MLRQDLPRRAQPSFRPGRHPPGRYRFPNHLYLTPLA